MTKVEVGDGGEELAGYPLFIEIWRGEGREANGRSIFGYWLGFWMNSIWVLVHMYHTHDIGWS